MLFKISYKSSSTIPKKLYQAVYIVVWRHITYLLRNLNTPAGIVRYGAPEGRKLS
jgi:hypothetical protein